MSEVSRRHALKLLVWTPAVIVTLDTTAAYADRHSTPPRPPQPPVRTSRLAEAPMGPALPTGLTGQLPYTDGADYRREVAAGVIALCAGFALIARGHEPRKIT